MRWTPLFVAFSLAACTAEVRTVSLDEDADASSLPSDPASFGTEDVLRTGLYVSQVDGLPVNDCGLLSQGVAPQTAHLDWIDADRFTWLEGTECVLWGSEYVCDLTVSRQAVAADAELVTSTHATGSIVDTETLEEEQQVTVHCEGPGCADYAAYVGADFPCEMFVETTPTWRQQ